MADKVKVDVWMPLWIGEYLADTMNLTTQQHGAYLLLLFAYWRNKGPLPDDDEDLAAITKSSPEQWAALRPKIARFFTVADGVWSHGRAEIELKNAGARRTAAAEKAKAAADAMWARRRGNARSDAPSIAPSIAPGSAQAELTQCPPPPPSPTESSVPYGTGGAEAPPSVDNPDSQRREAWKVCGNWLVENGMAAGAARELMGLVARDYPAVAVAACLAAAKKGPTPKAEAYLLATAKTMAGELRTVASAEADKTAAYLAEQARQREASKSPEAEAARLALVAKVRAA